jgi:hypothetical protein
MNDIIDLVEESDAGLPPEQSESALIRRGRKHLIG